MGFMDRPAKPTRVYYEGKFIRSFINVDDAFKFIEEHQNKTFREAWQVK